MDYRQASAYHEAAHAIIGVVLGLALDAVEVFPAGGGEARFRETAYSYAYGVMSEAGGLAARRADAGNRGASAGDREIVATALPDDLAPLRRPAARHAAFLVDREWRRIERVAAELARRGVLTGDEVRKLMEE